MHSMSMKFFSHPGSLDVEGLSLGNRISCGLFASHPKGFFRKVEQSEIQNHSEMWEGLRLH